MSTFTTLRRSAFLSIGLLAASASLSLAKPKDESSEEEEVDYLALGARLVADEHYDRAIAVLKEVDPKNEKVDRAKLQFLLGTCYLKKDLHTQARDAFLASIKAGQPNRAIYLYLAQTYFALKDYPKVAEALDKAGPAGRDNPGAYTLRAEALWRAGEKARALDALNGGVQAFPEFDKLSQMKVGYLMELGLYHEVAREGEKLLGSASAKVDSFIAVAEGLRRSKQLGEARSLMEQAHLRFPNELIPEIQLANVYNDLGRPLTGAMLYEQASQVDRKYSFEAAELYKEAGRLSRAMSLNARVLDPQKKLKQRLAILLQMERFELVAGMEPSLSRAGLLKDENIRYALAYGYYKSGDFDAAERHLRQLVDAGLFEKATALRKAMATCREAGWACY